MTQAYFNEEAKLCISPWPRWSHQECKDMQVILAEKGFEIIIVSRLGCDREYHDAWRVYREDIPQLIEELFRQRIVVEVQAEGKYHASIIFVYDYKASQIMRAARKFRKNKEASK